MLYNKLGKLVVQQFVEIALYFMNSFGKAEWTTFLVETRDKLGIDPFMVTNWETVMENILTKAFVLDICKYLRGFKPRLISKNFFNSSTPLISKRNI